MYARVEPNETFAAPTTVENVVGARIELVTDTVVWFDILGVTIVDTIDPILGKVPDVELYSLVVNEIVGTAFPIVMSVVLLGNPTLSEVKVVELVALVIAVDTSTGATSTVALDVFSLVVEFTISVARKELEAARGAEATAEVTAMLDVEVL